MYASIKNHTIRVFGKHFPRWATALLCVFSAGATVATYLLQTPLTPAPVLLHLCALGCIFMLYSGRRDAIALAPRELAERLLQVQEHERHRLSRELHDDIGQLLTAAKLQFHWLHGRLPVDLHAPAQALGETLDETLAKVRDLSASLNPRQLASLGLEASLRGHLLKALEHADISWSMECRQPLQGIAEEMAVAVFRITQEAVTNMLRHAQAQNLIVRVQRLPDGLSLHIADDGAGFNPATDPARAGQRGMAGMQERASLLGGTFAVRSQPGQGTTIDACFPWAPRTLERAHTSKGL
jgi:signal transduction histidine kinase